MFHSKNKINTLVFITFVSSCGRHIHGHDTEIKYVLNNRKTCTGIDEETFIFSQQKSSVVKLFEE